MLALLRWNHAVQLQLVSALLPVLLARLTVACWRLCKTCEWDHFCAVQVTNAALTACFYIDLAAPYARQTQAAALLNAVSEPLEQAFAGQTQTFDGGPVRLLVLVAKLKQACAGMDPSHVGVAVTSWNQATAEGLVGAAQDCLCRARQVHAWHLVLQSVAVAWCEAFQHGWYSGLQQAEGIQEGVSQPSWQGAPAFYCLTLSSQTDCCPARRGLSKVAVAEQQHVTRCCVRPTTVFHTLLLHSCLS